jgi:uncharacterized membrane protein YfcA
MAAGLASGALGIGGGIIIVPALTLALHYDTSQAVLLSLATIVPIALVGALSHYFLEPNNVLWLPGLLVIAGAIPGSRFGVYLSHKIRGRLLNILFAALFVVVAIRLSGLVAFAWSMPETWQGLYPVDLLLLGLLAGTLSSLFGIGGGIIIVPGLSIALGYSIHQAVATSLLVIVPTALLGALFYQRSHKPSRRSFAFMLPAALAGSIMGAFVTTQVKAPVLSQIFALILVYSAARMVMRSLRPKK